MAERPNVGTRQSEPSPRAARRRTGHGRTPPSPAATAGPARPRARRPDAASTAAARPKRTYTMRARAESARATHRRILEAAERSFLDRWYDEVTLDQVAEQAGVSKQTVLRRFGSKEGLFAAVADDLAAGYEPGRAAVPAGDLPKVAAALAANHERSAISTARLEAMEERFPALQPLVAAARARRREWIERTLAPLLPGRSAKGYRRRLSLLMTITSAQTWKQLRQDSQQSRRDAEQALLDLLTGVASLR